MGKSLDSKTLRAAQSALLGTDALRRPELGEMLARRYGTGCLEIIWQIANDASVDPAIRLSAARNLWEMGYGRPATVIRVPNMESAPGLDMEIAKAESASAALGELEEWGSKPPDEWPEHVRLLSGGASESGESATATPATQ